MKKHTQLLFSVVVILRYIGYKVLVVVIAKIMAQRHVSLEDNCHIRGQRNFLKS